MSLRILPRAWSGWNRVVGDSGYLRAVASAGIEATVWPLPELIAGVGQVLRHAENGHPAFFMGKVRTHGVWCYFPVLLLLKTPLAFLLLVGIGAVLVPGHRGPARLPALAPLFVAAALLVACMPTSINIGVRHILPVLPLLAIVAGYGVYRLWGGGMRAKWLAAGLVGAHLFASAWAHPDYLAYTSLLAGQHPERLISDSDLDWGQDLHRLETFLQQDASDTRFHLCYFGSADVSVFRLPPFERLVPKQPVSGLGAISVMNLQRDDYQWLQAYEAEQRIGKSIFLYRIPPQ